MYRCCCLQWLWSLGPGVPSMGGPGCVLPALCLGSLITQTLGSDSYSLPGHTQGPAGKSNAVPSPVTTNWKRLLGSLFSRLIDASTYLLIPLVFVGGIVVSHVCFLVELKIYALITCKTECVALVLQGQRGVKGLQVRF